MRLWDTRAEGSVAALVSAANPNVAHETMVSSIDAGGDHFLLSGGMDGIVQVRGRGHGRRGGVGSGAASMGRVFGRAACGDVSGSCDQVACPNRHVLAPARAARALLHSCQCPLAPCRRQAWDTRRLTAGPVSQPVMTVKVRTRVGRLPPPPPAGSCG